MPDPTRIVGVFLVDARGWVLLQERDEHAPIAPEQWGIVGGHVEPGEGWLAARDRELLEETGLRLPDGTLELFCHETVRHVDSGGVYEWQVYAGAVALTDRDIVCGEGRQIVFVDPQDVPALDVAEATAYFLPRFLASERYRRLALRTGRSREGSPGPAS